MVLNTIAGINQLGTETLSAKVQPRRLCWIKFSQLGQSSIFLLSQYLLNIYTDQYLNFVEVQTAPGMVVADRGTRELQLHRRPFSPIPPCVAIDHRTGSPSRRAAITIKEPKVMIRNSSDSLLATFAVPSAPRSPAVSTGPITVLSSSLLSHLSAAELVDPLPQFCLG
jgi:hypothetical protein